MIRTGFIFICAVVALIGSLTAVFATINERDYQLRGYVDPISTHELPYRVPRLGVNVELQQYTSEQRLEQFELMQQAGVVWVRQFARWDEIEPDKGEYNWSFWDEIVDQISDFPQLRLAVTFINTPQWARDERASTDPTAPPINPSDFADFVAQFAQRYGDTIDIYQIWDEPNLFTSWGGLEPRPADYAALLQAGYQAVHASDPFAKVLLAGLAPTTENTLNNNNEVVYLQDLYELGANQYFDAVAAKPYGFDHSPYDRDVTTDKLNFSRLILLREIMVKNGEPAKAIWASNWGWNALSEDWQGQPSIWGSVTGEQQITYTHQALDRVEREFPWLAGMWLYHWQPDAPENDPLWGFSLVDQNDQITPLLQSLIDNPYSHNVATNGIYPVKTEFARYSGVWTFSDLGADIGWQKDSRLSFDFTGTDVALILRQGDYVGYLYPTVDDQPANSLPTDSSGNSYIVLTSDTREYSIEVVHVSMNLPEADHTLQAIADRGFDQWALVGYAVSSGNLFEPYQSQLAVAYIAVLTSLLAVVVTAAQIPWHRLAIINSLIAGFNTIWHIIISFLTTLALMLGMLFTWGDGTANIFRRESVNLMLSMLTSGIIYLNIGFVITVVALLVLFVLIYNRIATGLVLIIFFAPFFLYPVELYSFAFPIVEILTIVTFTAWLLKQFVLWGEIRQTGAHKLGFKRPVLHTIDFIVLLWVVLAIFSLSWTEHLGVAITELRVIIIEPALFYLIFRTTELTRQDILRFVDTFILSGMLVALIGLLLFLQGEAVITAEGEARRLASVYGSPNNVALLIGRVIPFTFAMLITGYVDNKRRIFAIVTMTIMLIALLLTQSVGGIFVGVPAAIIMVLLLTYGRKAVIPIIVVIVIAGISFAILATQSDRFARALDFSSGTNFYRLRVWESGLNIIVDNPITGLGLDQFLYAFRGGYILPDAWQEPDLSHPHNFILDIWIRLSIVGLMLFVGLQVIFWNTSRKLLTQLSSITFSRVLIIGTLGSMTNLLVHGLIDNSIFVIDLAYIFLFLLSIILYFERTIFRK